MDQVLGMGTIMISGLNKIVKMKNIYYSLWVDSIVSSRKNLPKEKDWKFSLLTFISMLNALNLSVILIWVGYLFNVNVIWVKIEMFPGTMLNSFASFFIQFSLPFVGLNYFLIFRRNRYKKLIAKYPDRKGKLALIYGFFTVGILFFTVILLWLL